MKHINKNSLIVALLAVLTTAYGQEEEDDGKLKIDAGADLVSSYVWRGLYQAGTSFQPSFSLSAKGFTFGSWASADFSAFIKELDFYFSYEIKRFSIGIFDFWSRPEGTSFFKDRKSHSLELNLGYSFSEKFPLRLEVNTMFTGDDEKDEKGKRLYSTYISADYSFAVRQVDCEAGVAISPWKGVYTDKFNVAVIRVKASRSLRFASEYALPVFVELILTPAQDNAFLVFGLTF